MKTALYLLVLTLALLLNACSKEPDSSNNPWDFTVKDLTTTIAGNYTGTSYCSVGDSRSGYKKDTIQNQVYKVLQVTDSSISINSEVLYFTGSMIDKTYIFSKSGTNWSATAQFDHFGVKMNFGFWQGSSDSGSECNFSGTK